MFSFDFSLGAKLDFSRRRSMLRSFVIATGSEVPLRNLLRKERTRKKEEERRKNKISANKYNNTMSRISYLWEISESKETQAGSEVLRGKGRDEGKERRGRVREEGEERLKFSSRVSSCKINNKSCAFVEVKDNRLSRASQWRALGETGTRSQKG